MTFNDRKRCWIIAHTASEIDSRAGARLRVDTQLDTLRRYASDQGWEIVGETREPGVSGNAQNRPELVSLMEVAASRPRQFDILLVESVSRISRSAEGVTSITKCLEQYGIEVHTIDAALSNSGTQLLFLSSLFENHRRMRVAEGLRNRRLSAARSGLWSGPAPYGYLRVREADHGHALAIHEDEAKVVRDAFHFAFDRQEGLSATTRHLNNGGHITRDGKAWSVSAIKKMLENPIYSGRARIRTPLDTNNIAESITGIRVPVPRIISRQLFYSVQRMLRDRRRRRVHANPPRSRGRKRGE